MKPAKAEKAGKGRGQAPVIPNISPPGAGGRHLWSGKPLVWGAAAEEPLSVDTRIDVLLANPAARAVLAARIPMLPGAIEKQPMAAGVSLRRMADFSRGAPGGELLAEPDQELRGIRA